jgi:hypothetical protein
MYPVAPTEALVDSRAIVWTGWETHGEGSRHCKLMDYYHCK